MIAYLPASRRLSGFADASSGTLMARCIPAGMAANSGLVEIFNVHKE